MRKFLIVSLALMLVLGLSGAALAHYASIDQEGEYNFAFVGQYGNQYCGVDITQQGPSDASVNVALVVQQGTWCHAAVGQSACFLNFALVEQSDGSPGYEVLTIEDKINELAGMYYYWVVCFECPEPC